MNYTMTNDESHEDALTSYCCLKLSWGAAAACCLQGGSDYKLPNGMVIKQWQELETKFLFQEIFGSDSAYYREGLQFAPGQTIVDAGGWAI